MIYIFFVSLSLKGFLNIITGTQMWSEGHKNVTHKQSCTCTSLPTWYHAKKIRTILFIHQTKMNISLFHIHLRLCFVHLDCVEHSIYNDDGENLKFAMLSSDIVSLFPPQKFDNLKFLIKSKCFYLYNL